MSKNTIFTKLWDFCEFIKKMGMLQNCFVGKKPF